MPPPPNKPPQNKPSPQQGQRQAPNQKIEQLCDRATEALDNEQPDKALKLVEEALRIDKNDGDALVLKAEALVLLDEWDQAEEALEQAVQRHPDDPAVLLAAASLAVDISEGDFEANEKALERARRGEEMARQEGDAQLAGELLRVQGRAHSALSELRASAEAFAKARQDLPDDDDLKVELAMALFEILEFDDAKTLLQEAVKAVADDARAWHYLGLVAEREGKLDEAEKHFAKARSLDPEDFPKPVRIPKEDFDRAVEMALATLPTKVREYLTNVPIMVEDLPTADDLQGDPPLSPLSLGMFRGRSIHEHSVFDAGGEMPSSIALYQRNLERYARTREELIEEIETTLLHEVGHLVGWDDDDLYERGLE